MDCAGQDDDIQNGMTGGTQVGTGGERTIKHFGPDSHPILPLGPTRLRRTYDGKRGISGPTHGRKVSNVTNDSGRSSTIDHVDSRANGINQHERDTGNGTSSGSGLGEYDGRRHSVAVDNTGHLRVPTPSDNVSSSNIDPHLQSNDMSNYDSMGSSPSMSPTSSQSQPDSKVNSNIRTKHAPQIIYSYSEDRLMTSEGGSRQICPGLPYSPYGSPSSSPRLQRQPTRETRRLSITDSDGYTVLNQYKLKDEIGKVSTHLHFSLQFTSKHNLCFSRTMYMSAPPPQSIPLCTYPAQTSSVGPKNRFFLFIFIFILRGNS